MQYFSHWRCILIVCAFLIQTHSVANAENKQSSKTGTENSENDADLANGKALFDQYCIACHTGVVPEAPKVEALSLYTPERIVKALDSGVMSTAGLLLSAQEMRHVAYYLTGKRVTELSKANTFTRCSDDAAPQKSTNRASWTGWGGDTSNRRFQAQEQILNRDSVANLELKWAFAFPHTTRVRAQPTVVDGVVYMGSQDGRIYAIDGDSGCVHWTYDAEFEVRGAISFHVNAKNGKRSLLFGDFKANALSLDADSGELNWKTRVHEHELATITGSVSSDADQVYVPVSSSEVVPAATPTYACCTFRGALVALNIETGEIIWQTYTTEQPTKKGKNSVGVDRFGPSGAPIWSTPTVDAKRNLIYTTTGQNYSSPATGTSDAVLAIDRDSGEIQWVSQVLANDAWNGACSRGTTNCPEEDGPDFDIGASALLVSVSEDQELLLVGQKSGKVFALDPEQKGKIIWAQRVGKGGTMGGVHWGMSSDNARLYVGISDLPTNNKYAVGDPKPGVHALNPSTGEFLWRQVLPFDCPPDLKFHCFQGISAAVSSSPNLVFAGGLDGMLRAFDAEKGEILWSYNTRREFDAVNSLAANGGAIESDGPVIVDGNLYVTSGYDKWGELPGNVLLVFSIDGK